MFSAKCKLTKWPWWRAIDGWMTSARRSAACVNQTKKNKKIKTWKGEMSNETVLIYAALVVVGSSLFVVVVSTTAERAMCQPVVERSLVYLFLSLGERRGEREREENIHMESPALCCGCCCSCWWWPAFKRGGALEVVLYIHTHFISSFTLQTPPLLTLWRAPIY